MKDCLRNKKGKKVNLHERGYATTNNIDVDDIWQTQDGSVSLVKDGAIFDIDLHTKSGLRKRILPNDRSFAISVCAKDKPLEARKACFAGDWRDHMGNIEEEKWKYVSQMVEQNSNKDTTDKFILKMDIIRRYYEQTEK